MRRTKIGLLTSAALLALTGAAPAQAGDVSGRAQAGETAYFQMGDGVDVSSIFVIKLTDPAEIRHARDLLSGKTTNDEHIAGKIIKDSAPYNPDWSFHLAPHTIQFFDISIEVCDATINYVEDHLDEAGGAFLPGNHWCPWASHLVKEVQYP